MTGNFKRRFPALLLAALTIAASLAACGKSADSGSKSSETGEQTVQTSEAVTETQTTALSADIPDELDYGGKTVNVYYCPILETYNVNASEITGDNVNDALCTANQNVMENLNCVFTYSEGKTDNATVVKNSILAGDMAYDIIYGIQWTIAPLVGDHMLLNFRDNKYVDLSKPWWYSSYIEEAAAGNGNVYLLAGDLNLCTLRKASIGIVNNDMLLDLGMSGDDIYGAVDGGTWTLDMLYTLTSGAYSDLNGDSQHDAGDRYGIVCYTSSDLYHYLFDSGIRATKRDKNDIPYLCLNNESTISCLEKIYKLFHENNGMYYVEGADFSTALGENRVLFLCMKFVQLEGFRDIDTDFSVVPMPKLDETIENYSALVHDDTTIVCAPTNTSDPELVGAILELLASEGRAGVIEQYYDVSLKTKYSHDSADRSSAMIDIIHDSITTDFAYIYNYALEDILSTCGSAIISKTGVNFASEYAKNADKYQSSLEKLLAAMDEAN